MCPDGKPKPAVDASTGSSSPTPMRVLILGAYGLIGQAIARRLSHAGFHVTGLGRSADLGRRLLPDIAWTAADIATMTHPADWAPFLLDVDAVVNAAGALQDGARDHVAATQDIAIRALIAACEAQGARRIVQISAAGVSPDASTTFFRTKARADDALRKSGLDWVILRPGLVIGPNAYGGTALIRALAAFPLIVPLTAADSPIQTVALSDVADATLEALTDPARWRAGFDLVEPRPSTLRDVVLAFRRFQGFAPPRAVIPLPPALGRPLAWAGDLAGWLGWRPPLRTTALKVLRDGVLGDPGPWGRPLMSLQETLAAQVSTAQERVFARAALVFPVLVTALAGFWLASGAIGLWRWRAAAAVLDGRLPPAFAIFAVIAGALADLLLGFGILWRPATRRAALGTVLLTVIYLILGSWLTPALWIDPLGPFVKTIPAIALALAVAALAEER